MPNSTFPPDHQPEPHKRPDKGTTGFAVVRYATGEDRGRLEHLVVSNAEFVLKARQHSLRTAAVLVVLMRLLLDPLYALIIGRHLRFPSDVPLTIVVRAASL